LGHSLATSSFRHRGPTSLVTSDSDDGDLAQPHEKGPSEKPKGHRTEDSEYKGRAVTFKLVELKAQPPSLHEGVLLCPTPFIPPSPLHENCSQKEQREAVLFLNIQVLDRGLLVYL
jgi:hypothetical protein